MLRRLLTLLTVLTLACASAQAYVPERTLLPPGELASLAKTAPRGFAARAEPAAKERSPASDCCIRENWHPPLKLASSMQFTGHYREREGSAYYAQQRYYRPGLGRFNRVDPWAGNESHPITLNKYLYANGNPLAYVDPDGRMGWPNSLEDMPGYQRMPVSELHYVGGSPEARQAALDNMSPEQMAQYYSVQVKGSMFVASLAPGALLARGLYGLGATTLSAYHAGGAYHAANVAPVEGAALTESAILTGVGVTTGAEVPSVMSAPAATSRRLIQTAAGLDASLDALQPLQRVANQAELPMPQASLLSSSAAANRVQRAQPATVVEDRAVVGADVGLTISANPATGNPAAISRGLGGLNSRQSSVLERLPEFGSRTIAHKSFGQRDLAALTAATGDEFAMFSTGGRRLIYRGDAGSVPINPEMGSQLAGDGWRWSSHTHPGQGVGVLRSSPGDQAVLGAMGGNQSAIFNSMGQRGVFTPDGDSLNGWMPW